MFATPAANILPQNESKTAKKKRAKAEAAANLPQESTPPEPGKDVDAVHVNGSEGQNDSPYLKELYRNIRNAKKKLTSTHKTDAIIAENPGKTLDELLAERKINADQKAQVEKKPLLQATVEQLESQLEHYKKFDEESRRRQAFEIESLEQSHHQELEKARQAARLEAEEAASKGLEDKLLTLSRFLRAAAAKRSDGDDTAEENLAFEGLLLLIYGGDQSAVKAMENLINGSEDIVPTVEGQPSNFNFKHVRDVSAESAPPPQFAEPGFTDEVDSAAAASLSGQETTLAIQSDPTVTNAGLTEIDAIGEIQLNGENKPADPPTVPEASSVDAGAANAAADSSWAGKMSQSMTSGPDGFEIVEVPRDPAETETGLNATPAAVTATQSWAEDVPAEAAAPPIQSPNQEDGFREVHHHGRPGRGRGGFGRGEFRGGRGPRGRGDGFGGRGGDRRGRSRGPRGGRGRGGGGGGGGSGSGPGAGEQSAQ